MGKKRAKNLEARLPASLRYSLAFGRVLNGIKGLGLLPGIIIAGTTWASAWAALQRFPMGSRAALGVVAVAVALAVIGKLHRFFFCGRIEQRLAEDLEEGQTLRARCTDRSQPPPVGEINQWVEKTEGHLRECLGEGPAVLFSDFSPYTFFGDAKSEHFQAHKAVDGRLRRLGDFIMEL